MDSDMIGNLSGYRPSHNSYTYKASLVLLYRLIYL